MDIAGAAGVATAGEVGAETALIGAGAGLAGVVGTTALVGGVVLAAAGVVFGALCIFHAISICKKKVCTDPEGRWHSHSSHCTGSWFPYSAQRQAGHLPTALGSKSPISS